jgi:hypothetical protein
MRLIVIIKIVLLTASCKSSNENILINRTDDLWRVIQQGEYRSDSALAFFRFNSDNTFDELYFDGKQFKEMDSNPDVLNWHKWQQVNDSIFEVAYVEHRLISLTDSLVVFINVKMPRDTLALLRVKTLNGSFTSYR